MYSAFGPLSMLIGWINIALMMKFWHLKGIRTISKVAGSTRKAALVFGSMNSVGGVLFLLFVSRYFVPHFEPGPAVSAMLYASAFCMILMSFFPDFGGRLGRIHAFFAYTMGFFMFYVGIAIVYSHKFGLVPRSIDAGLIIIMFLLLFIATQVNQHKYIYYQLGMIAGSHLIVLVSTYIR